MMLVYGLIWGATVLFGACAVWGLVWAVQTGQLRELGRAGRTIFDDEEPVGLVTDTFPADQIGNIRQIPPGRDSTVQS